jgi:hypothetical protein
MPKSKFAFSFSSSSMQRRRRGLCCPSVLSRGLRWPWSRISIVHCSLQTQITKPPACEYGWLEFTGSWNSGHDVWKLRIGSETTLFSSMIHSSRWTQGGMHLPVWLWIPRNASIATSTQCQVHRLNPASKTARETPGNPGRKHRNLQYAIAIALISHRRFKELTSQCHKCLPQPKSPSHLGMQVNLVDRRADHPTRLELEACGTAQDRSDKAMPKRIQNSNE